MDMDVHMEYRTLGNTGLRLSILGFGAAPLGNEYGDIEATQGEYAVQTAIDHGINFFDTSPYYGRTLSEERLGAALLATREKVVLCTKLGRYGKDSFDFSASRVMASIDESLRRLRTDHVDMLIAHDIEYGDPEQVINETIPAMRKLQGAGKARFVGISGLPLKVLAYVAERARVDFILSYCHYNLNDSRSGPLTDSYCSRQSNWPSECISVPHGNAYAGGSAELAPAPQEVKEAATKIVQFCASRGVNVTTLALRFCLDYPHVSSTLVGMSSRSEVEQDLKALNFTVDPELLSEIEQILAPVKDRTWHSGRYQPKV